jgi:uncharacterized protein YbjT (DUF2867 family)
MKVVVIGGTGLVGSEVVTHLKEKGHDAIAASPNSGVDTITGEGLAEVLSGADVVIDAANAPVWDDEEVMKFFRTSSGNIAAAGATAGVGHYVAFSIVGADRLPHSGYLRAKVAQEEVIEAGSVPYTIVRSTQFFEFVGRIADSSADGDTVHLPPVGFQPAAAGEIAALVAEIAAGEPANGVVEVGGPEKLRFDEVIASFLTAKGDERRVIADPHARYFGTELETESLTTGDGARLTPTHFDDWLAQQ